MINEATSDLDASFEENLRSTPISFVRSGRYLDDTSALVNRGSIGFYWSSRASSATNAYGLYFHSTDIGPQYINNKARGLALRCVAR